MYKISYCQEFIVKHDDFGSTVNSLCDRAQSLTYCTEYPTGYLSHVNMQMSFFIRSLLSFILFIFIFLAHVLAHGKWPNCGRHVDEQFIFSFMSILLQPPPHKLTSAHAHHPLLHPLSARDPI
jgi:hypothetical protein